jgi:hypothetical protein
VSTPRKPDLDRLVRALTADGHPNELAGRDAAAAAFRAASRRDDPGRAARRRRRAASRRPRTTLPQRLAAIGAVLVVVAGIAAAAYAQALPGPAQDLAHTVFAPLGVPGNQRPGHPAAVTIATSGGKSGRATPGGAARTPSPRPAGDYLITVAVSRTRVAAGERVAFTGRVTEHGHAAARVRVRLFARLAGSAQFKLVATEVTGPMGGFRLPTPPLTANAIFRVVGPDAAHSVAVRVTVVDAPVTARATGA